jgi:hypothetical protein
MLCFTLCGSLLIANVWNHAQVNRRLQVACNHGPSGRFGRRTYDAWVEQLHLPDIGEDVEPGVEELLEAWSTTTIPARFFVAATFEVVFHSEILQVCKQWRGASSQRVSCS